MLKALDRFGKTEVGNVKQLEGFDPPLFRLRVGAWRFIYRKAGDNAIEVVRVLWRIQTQVRRVPLISVGAVDVARRIGGN